TVETANARSMGVIPELTGWREDDLTLPKRTADPRRFQPSVSPCTCLASRPQLDAAIATCKKHKAKLIVAKLDRLSPNLSFLLKLIEAGVEVLFADLPNSTAQWASLC